MSFVAVIILKLKEVSKIKVIGIVGKMGCGKSTISDYMASKLTSSIKLDVDRLAKQIYNDNVDIVRKIANYFGAGTLNLNGTINFKHLGRKVFSDWSEMRKLNDIMFPLIFDEVDNFIKNNSDKEYIIIDAAVLFDAGIDCFCDSIIWVKASKRKRENFIKCKDSDICVEDIRQRIQNQKIKINKEKVNFIVENNLTPESLFEKIDIIISKL
ncbi:MAG: dephospho-CoA kinase [Actinomycetota bacterium]|nr:dephospho-CoA kinase [Actinomycetota bacterium]